MKTKEILIELKEYIPFTLLATILAVIISLTFYKTKLPETLFELIHPLHIGVSAIVTAGIFYKYKKSILPAILVAITGSIIIGSLSDVIFPYLGGLIFNLNTSFHLPVLENPLLILSVSLIGGVIGLKTKITELPHFIHVFLSVFGSLFYILTFSTINLTSLLISIGIVFVAVLIPCCISDIIYPLLFIKREE